jgi:hypothetical protein
MKFTLKPYIILEGKGTKKDAMSRLYDYYGLSQYPNVFGTYGEYQVRYPYNDNCAWVYTIQVYKRGKHRKNKHYSIRVYKVPFAVLDFFKLKIIQKRNGVKFAKM